MSMRCKGVIAEWHDEQGYGFARQNGDGRRVFVHARNFARHSSHRPGEGDAITYRIGMQNGRECALDVMYANVVGGRARVSMTAGQGGSLWIWLASLYLTLVTLAVVTGRLPWTVLGYLVSMNALSYVAYALDKRAARHHGWRTPEARLHFIDLLGGWPAGLLAQKRLHHKTGKQSFQTCYRLTVLLHLTAVVLLFSSYGTSIRTVLFSN